MPNPIKKLLVLSSGGDAPGMNAVIRSVVRSAIFHELEVFGAYNGFYGLICREVHPLDVTSVANCIQRGGTILKSGRCLDFKEKAVRAEVINYLRQLGIDAIVVLGGDGSFRGASVLRSEGGPPVIGIPCTIDNDIIGTEYCIGFDTARNTALEAIDRIRDTAFSFDRNFIVEVMGRASGFLAVDVGLAGGAEYILIPEFPIAAQELVQKIQHKPRKKMTSIIVAAEANQPGRSIQLANDIYELSGIEYKVCILGHTQRGGTPSVMDRKLGSQMGAMAVSALLEGKCSQMVVKRAGRLELVDFPDVEHSTRYFEDDELLRINEMICNINDH